MKNRHLIFILFFIPLFINAQPGFYRKYGATVGSNIYSWERNVVIIPVNDGNYCIATFRDTNAIDVTLIKINPDGDTLWTKTYRRNKPEFVFDGEQTADGGCILAGSVQDVPGTSAGLLIKTNDSGDIIWAKKYSNQIFDWFYSVHQLPDGGFIAAGSTYPGIGSTDMYMVKVDSTGNIVWTKMIGSQFLDNANSMQRTSDNGFILAGATNGFGASTGRIYLVKTNSSGIIEWSKIYGNLSGESAFFIQQCPDSGFIVTGYTNSYGIGGNEVFLLKTNALGNFQWMKTYGSADDDQGHHVMSTPDGGFLITGQKKYTLGINLKHYFLFLIKTDQSGDTLWTRLLDNHEPTVGYSSCLTSEGGYMIATNPDSLKIFKTDSLGHNGCVEHNWNTIVTTAVPTVTSGATSSTGGTATNISFTTIYTPFLTEEICFTSGIIDYELPNIGFQLLPNPFNDKITVYVDGNSKYQLKIYNILANTIIDETISQPVIINSSHLSKGMYIYEFSHEGRVLKQGKIIKL